MLDLIEVHIEKAEEKTSMATRELHTANTYAAGARRKKQLLFGGIALLAVIILIVVIVQVNNAIKKNQKQ
jgi:t-SNARE complex subunit (syntaxin)